MAIPFILSGIGILFAMCAAYFYRMGTEDRAGEKKFLIDSLESLALDNAKFDEEVAQLQADNAKLRELVATYEGTPQEDVIDYLRQECIDWEDRYRTLVAENDKLRELFLDVWNDACEFDGFWDYVMDDGEIYNEDELPYYQERMRELGIEVAE